MKLLRRILGAAPLAASGGAPPDDFVPANELEQVLVRGRAGQASIDDFLDKLMQSQAVLLLDRELPPGGWDNSVNPAIFTSRDGFPVLAIFTSVERVPKISGFPYALLVDFRWILRGVVPGTGLVVNPRSAVGAEIAPHAVAELQKKAAAKPGTPALV